MENGDRRWISSRAPVAVMSVLVVAGALVLAACPPKHEMLYQAVNDFNNNIRWKKWEDAGAYMPPGLRAAFIESLDKEGDKLRITDFELKEFMVDEEGQKAVVRVKLAWYFEDVGVEKKGNILQRWERVDDKWALMTMEGEGPWKPEALKPKEIFSKDGGGDGGDGGSDGSVGDQ